MAALNITTTARNSSFAGRDYDYEMERASARQYLEQAERAAKKVALLPEAEARTLLARAESRLNAGALCGGSRPTAADHMFLTALRDRIEECERARRIPALLRRGHH